MIKLRRGHAALFLSAAALVAAGCGSSSKSQTSAPASTPATPSTPSTTSTTAAGGYAKQVDSVLAPLLTAIQGAKSSPLSANSWDGVAKAAGPAKTKVEAITPPPSVASLQTQLVSLLGRIETDSAAARDAINNHDAAAQKAAGQKVATDGHELSALAQKFKAAGYPI